MYKSNFTLWSSIKVKFERVINGLGGQNPLKCQCGCDLMGSSAKTGKFLPGASQEQKICSLDTKHKNVIWDRYPNLHIKPNLYVCRGVLGLKSSTEISLFIQVFF